MARAPNHKLGQIIGNQLELAIEPLLQAFADEHSLYLDRKGPRRARPGRVKVVWTDSLGNDHELDFVLERGGSDAEIGIPVAFIESAWRRYTKHSRNKAQEIQGAISALLQTYRNVKPFAGVILAGVFTDGSLDQLRSNGFSVVYVPYETIVDIFDKVGVDVRFDESTPDKYVLEQIAVYDGLDEKGRRALRAALRQGVWDQLADFNDALSKALLRRIDSVSVSPLHGRARTFGDIRSAIAMIKSYNPKESMNLPLARFEVTVRYSNGDRIVADFDAAENAVDFLRSYL